MSGNDFAQLGQFIDRYGLPLVVIAFGAIGLWRGWVVMGWVFDFVNALRDREVAKLTAELAEAMNEIRSQTAVYERLAIALEERNRLERDRLPRARS